MSSRSLFALTILITSTILLAGCSDGNSNDSKPEPFYDIEVFPTGDADADVQNLQGALAVGGTIYLRAQDENGDRRAFQLADEVLQMDTSVILVGELEGDQWSGDGMTRIVSGRLESHIPGTEIEIRGIHFVDPLKSAVWIAAGHNFSFESNRMTASTMQDRAWIEPLASQAIGILVSNNPLFVDEGEHEHSYVDITGKIQITKNYSNLEEVGVPNSWPADLRPPTNDTDGNPFSPIWANSASWIAWGEVAWANRHYFIQGVDAAVTIDGNKSFESDNGMYVAAARGAVDINDNQITLGATTAYHIGQPSVGIYYEDNERPHSGPPFSEPSVVISSNQIMTAGIYQWGIVALDFSVPAESFTISDNHISLAKTAESNPSGVGIGGGPLNVELARNIIEGAGTEGIKLFDEVDGHSLENDLSNLTTTNGDFVVNGEVIPESMYKDLDLGSL